MMGPHTELAEVIQAERSAALDDLLSRWHHYASGYRPVRSTSGGTATSDYRSSRQYDDANGALDDAIEATIMRQVGREIESMLDPWRSAIYAIARSLYTGAAVFHSPRIPPQDRARVSMEARDKITVRLVAAGLIE